MLMTNFYIICCLMIQSTHLLLVLFNSMYVIMEVSKWNDLINPSIISALIPQSILCHLEITVLFPVIYDSEDFNFIEGL